MQPSRREVRRVRLHSPTPFCRKPSSEASLLRRLVSENGEVSHPCPYLFLPSFSCVELSASSSEQLGGSRSRRSRRRGETPPLRRSSLFSLVMTSWTSARFCVSSSRSVLGGNRENLQRYKFWRDAGDAVSRDKTSPLSDVFAGGQVFADSRRWQPGERP